MSSIQTEGGTGEPAVLGYSGIESYSAYSGVKDRRRSLKKGCFNCPGGSGPMRTKHCHPPGGLLLVALMAALLHSCSYNDGAFRQISGNFFDAREIHKIVDSKTTEKEALAWLGPPVSTKPSATGGTTLHYFSVRRRIAVERRLWWRRQHSQTIKGRFPYLCGLAGA